MRLMIGDAWMCSLDRGGGVGPYGGGYVLAFVLKSQKRGAGVERGVYSALSN